LKLLVIKGEAELSSKGRSSLRILKKDVDREVPIRDIDAVIVMGKRVKISSGVPPLLSMHNIPLTIVAGDSISILYDPVVTRYNNYRKLQYLLDRSRALDIVGKYIEAKIQGMMNILRYYRRTPPQLTTLEPQPSDIQTREEELRLWEAVNSNMLWDKLIELIKLEHLKVLREQYMFTGRRPKHPDPFNKALSVMYAVIYSLATKALLAAGLDPTYGFLHRTRYSTPLTFDYTEQFKPVAIHATIDMVNEEGLPEIGRDGELTREGVNNTIKWLYKYLVLRHGKTGKTIYQYIFIKAYCLAQHLENKCPESKLAVTWDRRSYK